MSPLLLANAGLPMLMVLMPWMILGIIPVILIEAACYHYSLKTPWLSALVGSSKANLWSTFGGWVFAWGIMLGVQFVFLLTTNLLVQLIQFCGGGETLLSWLAEPAAYPLRFVAFACCSAWAMFPEGLNSPSVILAQLLVLLLPCYLVSYLGEAKRLQAEWPHLDPRKVYRHVWYAHLITYTLLYAVTIYLYLEQVWAQGLRWRW